MPSTKKSQDLPDAHIHAAGGFYIAGIHIRLLTISITMEPKKEGVHGLYFP